VLILVFLTFIVGISLTLVKYVNKAKQQNLLS